MKIAIPIEEKNIETNVSHPSDALPTFLSTTQILKKAGY